MWHSGSVTLDHSFASVTADVEGPLRPLRTGAMFPEAADVRFYYMPKVASYVVFDLRTIDERPVLVGISGFDVEDRPRELTAAEIHALPVESLTVLAVRTVAACVASGAPAPFARDPSTEGAAAVQARRRHAMTDELLREVAAIVNDEENSRAPTQAVKEHKHCSYRTAARWVAAARERGFLPRSERAPRDGRSEGSNDA